MPYNPKTGDHPEAVVKILLTVIEKTPSGGATLDDLKAAYREVKDREPSDKTISRIIKRINLLFDPLTYGEKKEEREEDEPEEKAETGSRAISVRKKNGRVTYIFTENLEKGKSPLDPGLAFLMALSLYPQQRNMLPGQFEVMMKIIFEDLLRKVVDWYRLRHEIERYIYISGYTPARPAENLRHIDNILSALRRKKRVKITYRRAYDGEVTRRELEPYGLLCRHNVWYLAGRCIEKNEQRVFRLDHIMRLEIVENSVASIPPDFSLKETYAHAWGVWTEEGGIKKPETVRLRVGKGMAEKFRVARYHESQVNKELVGGELEVTFTVTGAEEMIPWLMGWGPTIEVVEPHWLREAFVENLVETVRKYNNSATYNL